MSNRRPCHRKLSSYLGGGADKDIDCHVVVCSTKKYEVKEEGREEWRCTALYRWSEKTSGKKGHLRDTKEGKK